MGHSTGALLLTWLAIRNPDKVAGLILFSPAFGVHAFAQAGAWASYLTRIDLVTADGKVSTGHSGLEVHRPGVSSLAESQLTRRPSLHLCIRAAERRSGMDCKHRGGHCDSKARGASFYGSSKGKQLFYRFTQGIVAALFQSCAPRRDYHAVQSRPAAYQRLFARIFRSNPLSLVEADGCRWARLFHDQILQADEGCDFAFSGGGIALACRQIRQLPAYKWRARRAGADR
jgi:pimeloyl-ACP methyl ester carboxylesterase